MVPVTFGCIQKCANNHKADVKYAIASNENDCQKIVRGIQDLIKSGNVLSGKWTVGVRAKGANKSGNFSAPNGAEKD
ncbi:hypothetical protein AFK62_02185 [Cronobacter condimenti 1330]|uniref:Uncharacterized protein n=1 Tax=Cronobacter condimenti 1330 TaxID=1073999 RepID=A0ABM5V8B5_9ENTR|nr:hypothetical protein AFK62_02185 [Cronobacter condimenti 1330]